jgi:DUF1009 family protein
MAQPSLDIIGIIAGNGIYPDTFIAHARKAGVKKLAVCAFENETKTDIVSKVEAVEWVRVGQLSKMIKFFKAQGVTQCVMVGQIAPKNLFDLRPDLRTLIMMARLKQRNAETLFGAIGDELKKDGIELLSATTFLDELLAAPGLVAGPSPKKRRWEDVDYGFHIAKESSRLDIGQTVVVKNGTVLAVEAFPRGAVQRVPVDVHRPIIAKGQHEKGRYVGGRVKFRHAAPIHPREAGHWLPPIAVQAARGASRPRTFPGRV